jgi:hypothetical protein
MTGSVSLCFKNTTDKKLMKTGLIATARAPMPAVMFCIATT